MKSAAFIKMMSEILLSPPNRVTDFARHLKEGGLLSTGARGVNAPEMTPLDAARLLLALLTADSAANCVERVRRFGQIKYSPDFGKGRVGQETIQPDEFNSIFQGETLEDVLANILALPSSVGEEAAFEWFSKNKFHLRVNDFFVLAELFSWEMQDGKKVCERIVPFKGAVMVPGEDGGLEHVKEFSRIPGVIRTERSISGSYFLHIGFGLLTKSEGAVK